MTQRPYQFILIAICLGCISFTYISLGFLAEFPQTSDERHFCYPTIQYIHDYNRLPLYLINNDYMAPVNEWIAALLYRSEQPSLLQIRAISWFWWSLTVAATYLLFSKITTQTVAIGIAACTLFLNASTIYPIAISQPTYPFATLLIILVFRATIILNSDASFRSWLIFALIAAFSIYVFSLTIIPISLCFACTFYNSLSHDALIKAYKNIRNSYIKIFLCILASTLPIPLIYLHLQRNIPILGNSPTHIFAYLGTITACILLFSEREAMRLPRAQIINVLVALSIIYLIPTSIDLYYQTYEKPKLAALGFSFHVADDYALRSYSDYPVFIGTFLNRIIPIAFAGLPISITYYEEHVFDQRLILSALLVVLFLALCWHSRAHIINTIQNKRVFIAILACPIAITVVLVPSWRFNSDYSIRYIIPVLPIMYGAIGIILDKDHLSRVCFSAIAVCLSIIGAASWLATVL